MLDSVYIDLYNGAKTAQDASKLTSLAIEILGAAGFKLRKLKSNYQLWRENSMKRIYTHLWARKRIFRIKVACK